MISIFGSYDMFEMIGKYSHYKLSLGYAEYLYENPLAVSHYSHGYEYDRPFWNFEMFREYRRLRNGHDAVCRVHSEKHSFVDISRSGNPCACVRNTWSFRMRIDKPKERDTWWNNCSFRDLSVKKKGFIIWIQIIRRKGREYWE